DTTDTRTRHQQLEEPFLSCGRARCDGQRREKTEMVYCPHTDTATHGMDERAMSDSPCVRRRYASKAWRRDSPSSSGATTPLSTTKDELNHHATPGALVRQQT